MGNITLSNGTQKNLNICLDEIAQELSYFLVPFADGASSCSWSAVSKQEIAVKPKQMKHYCSKISKLSIKKQDLAMKLNRSGPVWNLLIIFYIQVIWPLEEEKYSSWPKQTKLNASKLLKLPGIEVHDCFEITHVKWFPKTKCSLIACLEAKRSSYLIYYMINVQDELTKMLQKDKKFKEGHL